MKSIKDPPTIDAQAFLAGVEDWQPYYPAGYPITDAAHNPWVTIDPISKRNAYDVWCGMDRTTDEKALRAALNALTNTPEDEPLEVVGVSWDVFRPKYPLTSARSSW